MSIDLVDSASQITPDGTTHTFSGLSIGEPAADRYIIALAGGRRSGPTAVTALTAIRIDGVPMTDVATIVDDPLSASIRISAAPITSGTTAEIEIEWNQTQDGAWVALYRATRLVSALPHDTETVSLIDTTAGLILDGVPGRVLAASSGLLIGGDKRYGSAASRKIAAPTPGHAVSATISASGIDWTGIERDTLADISEGATQPTSRLVMAAASFAVRPREFTQATVMG